MRFAFACAILGVWQLTFLATNVSGVGECPVKRASEECEHDIEPADQRMPMKAPDEFGGDVDKVRFYPERPGKYTLRYRAENLCGSSVRDIDVEVKCPPAPDVSIQSNLIDNALQNSNVEFTAVAPATPGGNPECQFQYQWTLYRLDEKNARLPAVETRDYKYHGKDQGQKFVTGSLKEPGQYEAEVTVDDGCAKKTVQYCFEVKCNCGPTANAKATQTIWTNGFDGKKDNKDNVLFTLDGSLSSDFDLAYSADEKLTYDWSITEWVPNPDMPRPVLTSQARDVINSWQIEGGKWSVTKGCVNQDMADAPFKVLCATEKLTKTYEFKHVPPLNAPSALTCYTENATNNACVGSAGKEYASEKAATKTSEQNKEPFSWILPDGTVRGTGNTWLHDSLSTAEPPFKQNKNQGAENENFMIDNWAPGSVYKPKMALTLTENPWNPGNIDPSTTSCMGYFRHTQQVDTTEQIHYRITSSTLNTGQETRFCKMIIKQTNVNNPVATLELENPINQLQTSTLQTFQFYGQHGAFEVCRGLWTFRLTVQDQCATNRATDDIMVTVRCNRPPVAIAGCAEAVTFDPSIGGFPQVTVDGRFSRDDDNPEMNGLTYFWSFESAPAGTDYKAECANPRQCSQHFCKMVVDKPERYKTCVSLGASSTCFGHAVMQGSACPDTCTEAQAEVQQRSVQYAGLRLQASTLNCGLKVYPVVYDCGDKYDPAKPSCAPIENTEYHRGNSAYFTPQAAGDYKIKLQVFDGCSLTQDVATVQAVCPELAAKIMMKAVGSPDAPVSQLTLQYSVGATSVELDATAEYGDIWESERVDPKTGTAAKVRADPTKFKYEWSYYTSGSGCKKATAQECCMDGTVVKKPVLVGGVPATKPKVTFAIDTGNTDYIFCLKITDSYPGAGGLAGTIKECQTKSFASGILKINCNASPTVRASTAPAQLTQTLLTAPATGLFSTVTARVSPARSATAVCAANEKNTEATGCDSDNDALTWTWGVSVCKKNTCQDADYREYQDGDGKLWPARAVAAENKQLALADLSLRGLQEHFYQNGNGQLQFKATASVTDACSTVSQDVNMIYRCQAQPNPTVSAQGGAAGGGETANYEYNNNKFQTLTLRKTSQAGIYTNEIINKFCVREGNVRDLPADCNDDGCPAGKKDTCSYTPAKAGDYTVFLTVSDQCTSKTSAAKTFRARCSAAQVPQFSREHLVVETRSQSNQVSALAEGAPLIWDSYKFMPKGNKYSGGFPDLQITGCKDESKCKSIQGQASSLWYFFYGTEPGKTETQIGAADSGRNSRLYTISTAGDWTFALKVQNGPNIGSGCESNKVARSIRAQCLTINPRIALKSSTDSGGSVSIVSSWNGLSFQDIHMVGAASGDQLYRNAAGEAQNLDALAYRWIVRESPKASRWVKKDTKTNTDEPTRVDIGGATDEKNATSQTKIQKYRLTTRTSKETTETTLFNHHHNMPITGFRPDVVGDYIIDLEVRDGCTTATAPATIRARCPTTGGVFRGAAPIQAKSYIPDELHAGSSRCENCNPRARPFGEPGTNTGGGNSPTITIAGNSFRRVIADARDILAVPTGNGPACSSLTYSWSLMGPKQDDPTFAETPVMSLTDSHLSNNRGNVASFVPQRSGKYTLVFRACRDAPEHSTAADPMTFKESSAMCQVCETRNLEINVKCDTSGLPTKKPESKVVNQNNGANIHYIPRAQTCDNQQAVTGRDRFKDPKMPGHAYFELTGDPKPTNPSSCNVLKRQWILWNRQCAKSFTATPPVQAPIQGPTCKPADNRKCSWTVVSFPCGWQKTDHPANTWVDNCAKEGCNLNPQDDTTCIAPFRCKRPGTYTLELKVKDQCSTKTQQTTVVCKCKQQISISAMQNNMEVVKTCDETKLDAETRVFKKLELSAEITTGRGGPADLAQCPSPAPAPAAPAAPAGACCPPAAPCAACKTCPACIGCPGSASSPGQGGVQAGAAESEDIVVPGAILGALPLSTTDDNVESEPVAPAVGGIDVTVPGALLPMAAVPGAVVPGTNAVPSLSAKVSDSEFPMVEEVMQKRSALMSKAEEEGEVSTSLLLGVVIPISLIIVGSLIGNILMFNKLRRVNRSGAQKFKSLA